MTTERTVISDAGGPRNSPSSNWIAMRPSGGESRRVVDTAAGPWCELVFCRNGILYPVNKDVIGAVTPRTGEIVQRLREIEGGVVLEDGSRGAHLLFPLGKRRYVQRVMQARQTGKRYPSDGNAVGPGRPRVRPVA